jgi:hypothetical protein
LYAGHNTSTRELKYHCLGANFITRIDLIYCWSISILTGRDLLFWTVLLLLYLCTSNCCMKIILRAYWAEEIHHLVAVWGLALEESWHWRRSIYSLLQSEGFVEADLVCWPSFLLEEADFFFYSNKYPLLAEFPSLQGRISPYTRPISLQQGYILL